MKNDLTPILKTAARLRRALAIVTCYWLTLAAFAPFARATAYVSNASGNLSTTTIWTPNGTPGLADTVEISSGNLVTNASGGIGAVTIDSGGNYFVGTSHAVGAMLNNGTLTVGNNTTARTLTFKGNLTNNGLITTASSTPTHSLTFSNSVWLGSGDISAVKGGVAVKSGAFLDLSGLTTPLKFKSSGAVGLTVNGMLIAGTQVINGNGNATCTFTLAAGATNVTANPNGIINGATGMLNFAGAATFDPAANYVFNGTSAQVTTGLPATANNLTITNAAGVTLSAPILINGTLELNSGILTTSSSATPTNAAVTATGGSYVSGPMALVYTGPGSQVFPIGKGGNARNVTINYTALTGSSTVTVEQFESAMGGTLPSGTTQFGSRYWAVSQIGGSGITFDLTLDGTGYSPANTAVMLQQGTPATSYGTSFSSPNYTATGITSTGNFTLGNYAPGADQLAFTTSAQTLTAGVASGTITVQLQNSGGTPKTYATNLTVSLGTTSAGGAFRDMGDTTTITSVTITAGNNSTSFKYKDTLAPGTPTITASAPGGITPATQIETVNVGAASKLAFTTQPASGNFTYAMPSVVVQIEDQFGNLVLQSGTAITLALNNGGSSVLMGTIPQNSDGAGAATFGDLMVTVAPATGLTLTASSSGLTPAVSSSFDMTPRAIVKAKNQITLDQTTSWTNGVLPGQFDVAQIDNNSVGNSGATANTDLGPSSTAWYGLNIFGWTGNVGYTVSNYYGQTITLGSGGIVGSNATHTLTLQPNFALTTVETWSWDGTGGTLNLNGDIANATYQLTLYASRPISVGGNITGAGGLIKQGTNTLTLRGSVAAGSPLIISSGTLAGTGVVNRAVSIQGGAQLAPGATGIGTLTINSNLTLNAASSVSVEVDQTSATSDLVTGVSNLVYAGTLTVANLTGTLTNGSQFTLFSAANPSGNFGVISGSPGAGKAWAFNPTNGVLSVIGTVATNPTNINATVSGGALTLTWPEDHLGWVLQSQTNNLNVGLATNWVDVGGSELSTTNVITINPANPGVFYRLREP